MNTLDPTPYDDPDIPMPPASPPTPEDSHPTDTPMPSVPEEIQQVSREETYPPPAPPPPESDSVEPVPPTDITSPEPTRKVRKPPTPEEETEPMDKNTRRMKFRVSGQIRLHPPFNHLFFLSA